RALLVPAEVVSLEQMKSPLPLTLGTQFAQIFDRQREKTANPFLLKKLLERFGGWNRSSVHHRSAQFLFGAGKIQGDVRDHSSAFLSPSGLVLVHHKAVHTKTQIGAQPASAGIEFLYEFAFEQLDKKSLGEILGRIGRAVPAQTDILVDGLPIRRAQ